MRKTQSMRKILFTSILTNTGVIIVCVTLIISVIQYSYLHKSMENEVLRTCSSVAGEIDVYIQQMDTVCLNTIHSEVIKKTFSAWADCEDSTSYELTKLQNTLSGELTTVKGMDASIRQINLYSFNNKCFGTGNYTGSLTASLSDTSWYEDVAALSGRRMVAVTQNIAVSGGSGSYSDRYYLSLYRMFYDEYNTPAGIAEVMVYYDTLFESALYPQSSYDLDIYIYDDNGELLFPLSDNGEEYFDYYAALDPDRSTVYNTVSRRFEFACSSTLDYCGFTVVAAISTIDFITPILYTLLLTILLILCLFIPCSFLASMTSQKLSRPLSQMYDFLSDMDPHDQFREIQMDDTFIIEIDKLRDSLNSAMHSQKEAARSLILMKEQEIQSQMLALQSQMNPHFLYNSLNTIGAMAEEGLTEPVAEMCKDITSILRYISSNREQVSTLEEELEHCDLYLKCLKLRFGNALSYDFEIEDNMLDLPVPKLCVQLLIENSVKFASRTDPPWKITVRGTSDEDKWYIDVLDNGTGFDGAVSEKLRSQMDYILSSGLLPSLELDGMGILNIFIRLYLIYGITFIFDFGNRPEGGAFVRIGGHFDNEKDKTL